MFTGIVTDVGRVRAIERRGDTRLVIGTSYDIETIAIGASVACSGCCLTAVDKGKGWFAVDASAETLAHTNLGTWREGTPVNLERPLKFGDELGGHLVSGHVDDLARIVDRRPEGDSVRFVFEFPQRHARFIAPKGSVAIDGISLTVNEVSDNRFGVNIIPHTQQATTLGAAEPGQLVNLEVDLIARYLARLAGKE